MINTKELWKKRSSQYFGEIKRYLRYMLNDHLLIAIIILLGGAANYYNGWLKELPADFPYAPIIAVILAVMLTNSRIQTVLKEPDLVFLLPVEKQLTPYFQKAFWFSLVSQSYMLLFLFAATAPLYFAVTDKSFSSLLAILGIVVLGKIWNLLLSWYIQYYNEPSTRYSDISVRFILNFVLLYFAYSHANVLFVAIIIILMVGMIVYFQQATKQKGLKWDYLIDLESRRMMSFYRLANLFTDVPKLKERVKRRAWINWVTKFITYSRKNSFEYLYTRTFLRTSDYFGMYIRLTIIGGLILYFIPLDYGKAFIAVLFLYLTGYQLITLWRHHHLKIWIRLYPIETTAKLNSFLKILFKLIVIQTIVFTVVVFATLNLKVGILVGAVGILFAYLFVFYYVKSKVKKIS